MKCSAVRGPRSELYIQYHDTEWGVPVHDDRLPVRVPDPRRGAGGPELGDDPEETPELPGSLRQFDPAVVAKYGQKKSQELAGRCRDRPQSAEDRGCHPKCPGVSGRARQEIGTFDEYIWGFVGHEPKQNAWRSIKEVPAKTPESDAMSKDLKRRGFKFVGSTICYAFMQAVGMVNDHLVDCFRHGELRKSGEGRR